MTERSPADAAGARIDAAAEANFVLHMGWVQARTPGMRVEADGHLTLIDSGLPCDTFNVVCAAHLPEESLRERIGRAIGYFREARRPFAWWVGPADEPAGLGQALLDAGLVAAESETAMAADLDDLPPADSADLSPGGLRIERARTPEGVRAFAAVIAANWTPPDPNVPRFYEAAMPLLLSGDCPLWLYVGYIGGEPVAACEVTAGGGVAGLYNVCTLESHRRRGYAGVLVQRGLLDAREAGFRTAVLQASQGGRNIYARIGFRATGTFTEYHPPADWRAG